MSVVFFFFFRNDDAKYTTQVCTLPYRCIELVLGSEFYDKGVDMWSCGCILYELILRKRLFQSMQEFPLVSEVN
jgi:serine/threonine protein kinase